jgi:hypothetical protein
MSQTTNVAELTYDAVSRCLSGAIGTASFSMLAESGGGRGRTKGVADTSPMSHLATTKQHIGADPKHPVRRGGTLPPGKYTCVYVGDHPKFHECIRLNMHSKTRVIRSPFASQPIVHHRDHFYIHGRGALGSDGCLVPLDIPERLRLTHAIKNFKGTVILTVTGVGYLLPAENFLGMRS